MPERTSNYDVAIVGGSSGGVAAAIAARRVADRLSYPATIAFVYEHPRSLGGMLTNGVSSVDIHPRRLRTAPNGLMREFTDRVARRYASSAPRTPDVHGLRFREGLVYEPAVGHRVVREMLAATPGIDEFPNNRIADAERSGRRVTSATVTDRASGNTTRINAKVFIDATVEGDLLALIGAEGVDWVAGREGRSDLMGRSDVHPTTAVRGEDRAGEILLHPATKRRIGGSGAGDDRSQSFTYRMTWVKGGWVPPDWPSTQPTDYSQNRSYYRAMTSPPLAWGRACPHLGLPDGMWVQQCLPGGKADINIDPLNVNHGYVHASEAGRTAIEQRIRSFVLGYLYFVREELGHPTIGLSVDDYESVPNGVPMPATNLPPVLYVREGRRLLGEYIFTEWDALPDGASAWPRQPDRNDFIAIGEYPMDSHCVSGHDRGLTARHGTRVCEGGFWLSRTVPYQVPYGTLVPRHLDGLLVPIATSASHVGYSTLRMEAVRMNMGQAAGAAAIMAARAGLAPRNAPIARVQWELVLQGQMLRFSNDLPYHSGLHPSGRRRAWTFPYMQLLAGQGVVHGYADHSLRPDVQVTRGQLAKLVVETINPPPRTSSSRFSDLPRGHPYHDYVARIDGAGWWPDWGDRFKPNSRLTRAELAHVLRRAAGIRVRTRTSPPAFADVPKSHPAFDDVQSLVDARYLFSSGPPARYRPNDQARRADAARILAMIRIRR
ncbi:MAG: FAD-dependent oxidoreductase [Acidimicrobiia bacterium]|nr:FAD-dependent oxidoreductase [Acidimicrobiia bacterium]